jgi:hypothetical protein
MVLLRLEVAKALHRILEGGLHPSEKRWLRLNRVLF